MVAGPENKNGGPKAAACESPLSQDSACICQNTGCASSYPCGCDESIPASDPPTFNNRDFESTHLANLHFISSLQVACLPNPPILSAWFFWSTHT
jgi:hypothetical protein